MTKSDALKLKRSRVRAKKLIEQIVEVLNEDNHIGEDAGSENTSGGRALWDILTALRGPDGDDTRLKDETTAKVRAAIGMKAGNAGAAIVSDKKPFPSTDSYDTSIHLKFLGSARNPNHFTRHYGLAVRALTLLGFLGE